MTFLCLNQVYGAGKVAASKRAAKPAPEIAKNTIVMALIVNV